MRVKGQANNNFMAEPSSIKIILVLKITSLSIYILFYIFFLLVLAGVDRLIIISLSINS